MPHINLLPWREEQRTQRNKDYGITCFLFAILVGVAVGSVHYWYSKQLEWQNNRNDYIKAEIAKLDRKIDAIKNLDAEKERLLARMQIIQQLQASRPEIVHVFDEIVETLPEGIFYKKIVQKGRSLTLSGVAQSNARVSSLMRNLENSTYLDQPELQVIIRPRSKSTEETALRLSDFTLNISQTKQKKKGKDEDESS